MQQVFLVVEIHQVFVGEREQSAGGVEVDDGDAPYVRRFLNGFDVIVDIQSQPVWIAFRRDTSVSQGTRNLPRKRFFHVIGPESQFLPTLNLSRNLL